MHILPTSKTGDGFHIYRGQTGQCWLAPCRISALGKVEWGRRLRGLAHLVRSRDPLSGPNPRKREQCIDESRTADSISRETELLTAPRYSSYGYSDLSCRSAERTLQIHRFSFKNTACGLFQKHIRSELPKTRVLFKPYTSCLMTSPVSERRSPPFPGVTHARRVAPGARKWWYRLHSLGNTHPPRAADEGASVERPQAEHSLRGPAGRPEAAPSPRPPRKRRREMPTSGKPAADGGGGGGDTEWKAKWRRQRWPGAEGRARSSRPRVGPRWPAAAPRRVSPPCPILNPERR